MNVSASKIARNGRGWRVGECHQRARLPDKKVRQMRKVRELTGISFARLAIMYGVGESTVRDICEYRTRGSA